jgi:hypothetical protein
MDKEHKLQKHLVNLFAGDMDRLKAVYAPGGGSVIIRKLVRMHLQLIDAKIIEKMTAKELEE